MANKIGAAAHTLSVRPGDHRLILSCSVCGIIDFEPSPATLETLQRIEEEHMLMVAKKLLDS